MKDWASSGHRFSGSNNEPVRKLNFPTGKFRRQPDPVVGQYSTRRLVKHEYPFDTDDAGRAQTCHRSGQRDAGPVSSPLASAESQPGVFTSDGEDERLRLRRTAHVAVVQTTDEG
jgi:hypothetical protein